MPLNYQKYENLDTISVNTTPTTSMGINIKFDRHPPLSSELSNVLLRELEKYLDDLVGRGGSSLMESIKRQRQITISKCICPIFTLMVF